MRLVLEADASVEVAPAPVVTDVGDGRYTVSFTASAAGRYSVALAVAPSTTEVVIASVVVAE